MTLTVVSFHTGQEIYRQGAKRLAASCREFGLPYLIASMPSRETWVENVSLKGPFLWHCIRRLRRPLLWIDCDGWLEAKPDLLKDTDADFGVYAKHRARQWKPVGWDRKLELPANWPHQLGPRWFLTGTLFVRNSEKGFDFLNAWDRLSQAEPRSYQQLLCQRVWCDTRPNTIWLPESYCSIRGKAKPTVICHELASVKQKGIVRR